MNQPLVIEETWVREALLTVLPPGIVGHRLPEVMAEIGKAPQTWTGIEEAFFRPLHLFIRHHDPRREQLRLRLAEQIERVLIQDDRPYVSEWIEAQKLDWMRQDKPSGGRPSTATPRSGGCRRSSRTRTSTGRSRPRRTGFDRCGSSSAAW